jgi:hypothetical protein
VVDKDELFWIAGASYLSIGPGLNLLGQVTYLSLDAKARNVPLPDDAAAHAGEHHAGDDNLALRHLLSSMTLRRLS